MNTLLLFFALPVATIILSVVLQRLLNSPILVALTAFAIYLIVAFSVFDETFLVFVIAYTILAFLSAVASNFIARLIRCISNRCNNNQENDNGSGCGCGCNNNSNNDNNQDDSDSCMCANRSANYYGEYSRFSRRFR